MQFCDSADQLIFFKTKCTSSGCKGSLSGCAHTSSVGL